MTAWIWICREKTEPEAQGTVAVIIAWYLREYGITGLWRTRLSCREIVTYDLKLVVDPKKKDSF